MATTDNGGQILSYDFKNPGTSQSFNRINYGVRSNGFFSGGEITKVTDTSITVSPFVAHINISASDVGVRLETTSSASVTTSSTTPYVVVRLAWTNVENNYADIISVAHGDIESDDLIIGKLIYDGVTLTTDYDYSEKTWSANKNLWELEGEFKITPTSPYSNTLNVSSGNALINGKLVEYGGGVTPTLSNTPVGASRNDVLSLDADGNLNWTLGTATASPEDPIFPSQELILAIIRRGVNRTDINGTETITVVSYKETENLSPIIGSVDINEGSLNTTSAASSYGIKVETTDYDSYSGIHFKTLYKDWYIRSNHSNSYFEFLYGSYNPLNIYATGIEVPGLITAGDEVVNGIHQSTINMTLGIFTEVEDTGASIVPSVAGYNGYYTVANSGEVYSTNDNGDTWTASNTDDYNFIFIELTAESYLVAATGSTSTAGVANSMYSSLNGATWTLAETLDGLIKGIAIAQDGDVAVVTDADTIYTSNDNGQTYPGVDTTSVVNAEGTFSYQGDMYIFSNQTNFHKIYKSSNGGINWTEVYSDLVTSNDIDGMFANTDTGDLYTYGTNMLISTDDGGSWSVANSLNRDLITYINGLYFIGNTNSLTYSPDLTTIRTIRDFDSNITNIKSIDNSCLITTSSGKIYKLGIV